MLPPAGNRAQQKRGFSTISPVKSHVDTLAKLSEDLKRVLHPICCCDSKYRPVAQHAGPWWNVNNTGETNNTDMITRQRPRPTRPLWLVFWFFRHKISFNYFSCTNLKNWTEIMLRPRRQARTGTGRLSDSAQNKQGSSNSASGVVLPAPVYGQP